MVNRQARSSTLLSPYMRHPTLTRLTCWMLLLFFPAAMNAMPAQGLIQAQGTVLVNGKTVSNSAAIFAGDRIETEADGMAILSSQGVMVQLQPNTTAIFTGRSLDLGCGDATVITSVGTMVRVANIVATPAAQNTTKIHVSQANGTIKITPRDNWAVVSDGRIRQTLAPKQTATFQRPGTSCEVAIHGISQASTKVYLPAAAVVGALGAVTYCTVTGPCSEVSPSAP